MPLILRWPDGFPSVLPRGTVVTDSVTELRDIVPTLLAAAGALSPDAPVDGAPVTCLLTRNCSTPWREWIDLEHSAVYNASVAHSTLTDGRTKYVFRPHDATEQLFDLVSDAFEMQDLAEQPAWASTLTLWRGRMVAQFEAEGRGELWVRNGTLQRRVNTPTYGPNYPGGCE